MTHSLPFVPSTRASVFSRTPDTQGWYVFRVGDEVRCPGIAPHKKAGISTTCNKYFCTVEEGEVWVRPLVERRVRQVEVSYERRTRFSRTCPHRDGCGTSWEYETHQARTDHAA